MTKGLLRVERPDVGYFLGRYVSGLICSERGSLKRKWIKRRELVSLNDKETSTCVEQTPNEFRKKKS